jgi:hypothetical protein
MLQAASSPLGTAAGAISGWILNDLPGAEGNKQNQRRQQQDQRQCPRQTGSDDLPPMEAMELGPGGHFGLVGGFDPLLVVPPGTRTVDVRADFGSTDGSHTPYPIMFPAIFNV